MEQYPKRGDYLSNWEENKGKKKIWNILSDKKKVEEKVEEKSKLKTDLQVEKKTDVQWKKGLATHQFKILESRSKHNVVKDLFIYHASLVEKLRPNKELQAEIYSGALSWNYNGSRLMAGGDHMLRIWSYPEGDLVHAFSTGLHSFGINSATFIAESPERVVSGTGKIQLWDIDNEIELGSFDCHLSRVSNVLAVEGSPEIIWSASKDGTVRAHDMREASQCNLSSPYHCKKAQVHLNLEDSRLKSLGEKPIGDYEINSFDINPARPYSILIGGSDCFARLFDIRNNQPVQYYCPKHLSTLAGSKYKHINHVAFSSVGSEALISYRGEHLYLIDMKQERLKNVVIEEYGANVYEPEEYGVEEAEEVLKFMTVSESSSRVIYSSEEPEEDSDDVMVVDKAFDTTQRYVGHTNLDTNKKEANFIGKEGQYIACGSDQGMLYIYEKRSGRLISKCLGHTYGLNCVQSHPRELAIATSGFGIVNPTGDKLDIEQLVKIWTPDENGFQCMQENQQYFPYRSPSYLPSLISDQIDWRRRTWI